MIYILINIWPILAATVAGLVFGTAYHAASRGSEAGGGGGGVGSPVTAVIAFAAEFWIACILAGALILAPEEAGEWTMAIGTAVVIWIGFVAPSILVSHRYERRSWGLTAKSLAHWLGVFLVHVVVLQLFGLEPPPGA